MLSIVRIKTRNGSDVIWDYVLENKDEITKEYKCLAELMYMTKRTRHEDTSLFTWACNPDALGSFVADKVACFEGVEGIWMFPLMNMRFFATPEDTFLKWRRHVVTVKAHPSRYSEIYKTISGFESSPDTAPAYITYTFHLFGDSLMFSFVAKDDDCARGFVRENIESIPGVTGTTLSTIKNQVRLSSKEDWKDYVKSNMIPKMPKKDE